MLRDGGETWTTLQKTDGWRAFEKLVSGTFVRNTVFNFATVSTQVLIIHKSGLAYATEHSYDHS